MENIIITGNLKQCRKWPNTFPPNDISPKYPAVLVTPGNITSACGGRNTDARRSVGRLFSFLSLYLGYRYVTKVSGKYSIPGDLANSVSCLSPKALVDFRPSVWNTWVFWAVQDRCQFQIRATEVTNSTNWRSKNL